MSTPTQDLDDLVGDWLPLPQLADAIGESVSAVRLMIRDGRLVAVRRGDPAVVSVPAAFVHDGALVKGLVGTLTLLRDSGFDDTGSLAWLFTPDDVLGARPVDLMAAGRHTAVKRRAQLLAL